MELIETCFLTKVSIVMRNYSVTLGGRIEHLTADAGVSAYEKYSV